MTTNNRRRFKFVPAPPPGRDPALYGCRVLVQNGVAAPGATTGRGPSATGAPAPPELTPAQQKAEKLVSALAGMVTTGTTYYRR